MQDTSLGKTNISSHAGIWFQCIPVPLRKISNTL